MSGGLAEGYSGAARPVLDPYRELGGAWESWDTELVLGELEYSVWGGVGGGM